MDKLRYREESYRQKYNAGVFGTLLSAGVNLAILLLCSFSGFKYIYPPPEEKTLVVDFVEEQAPEIEIKKYGREPSAEEVEIEKPVEFVQKSEAQTVSEKANTAPLSTVGPQGDVEVPEPPREEVIDKRALFSAPANSTKDTLAPHTAKEISDALKAGHSSGNASAAKLDGSPSARVKGRSTVGLPARPSYGVQNEGIVVVSIWVDQQGAVMRAVAGAEGTTVTDSRLWNAAREAALKTKFNMDAQAPGLQEGTITYIFKLK